MKKILPIALMLMLLALTACGNSDQQEQQTTPPAQETENTPPAQTSESESELESTETDQPQETGGEGGVLVVYYSATGSTEAVAGYIADALNADLFEIVPAEPYTSDDLNWTNSDSRVCQEHDDPALRTMELTAATVDNWDSYDTIFIGYPIWWGIAAWPVDNFVTANDFSGKTVIPFCTSASSGLGESGELLAELAGTGDWLEGQRFSSSASETDVTEWVNGLDLNK